MRRFVLVFAAIMLLALPTFATVTYCPGTGVGFVGKGDVQAVYGWNNAQLQRNAGGITFAYKVVTVFTATCTWTTGPDGFQSHTITRTKTTGINDQIAYNARSNKQIDGFLLTGFGSTSETDTGFDGDDDGNIPVDGTSCPGKGTNGIWSVTSQSTGGLYVIFNGTNFGLLPLWTNSCP